MGGNQHARASKFEESDAVAVVLQSGEGRHGVVFRFEALDLPFEDTFGLFLFFRMKYWPECRWSQCLEADSDAPFVGAKAKVRYNAGLVCETLLGKGQLVLMVWHGFSLEPQNLECQFA